MAKYTNKEQTQVESQGWHGAEADLIRLGYLDKDEPIEPYQEPVPTGQDKIYELEQQQTARLLRNAALGDQYAIDKLQSIESGIAALREEIKA